jgi:hypothetical protein
MLNHFAGSSAEERFRDYLESRRGTSRTEGREVFGVTDDAPFDAGSVSWPRGGAEERNVGSIQERSLSSVSSVRDVPPPL